MYQSLTYVYMCIVRVVRSRKGWYSIPATFNAGDEECVPLSLCLQVLGTLTFSRVSITRFFLGWALLLLSICIHSLASKTLNTGHGGVSSNAVL